MLDTTDQHIYKELTKGQETNTFFKEYVYALLFFYKRMENLNRYPSFILLYIFLFSSQSCVATMLRQVQDQELTKQERILQYIGKLKEMSIHEVISFFLYALGDFLLEVLVVCSIDFNFSIFIFRETFSRLTHTKD